MAFYHKTGNSLRSGNDFLAFVGEAMVSRNLILCAVLAAIAGGEGATFAQVAPPPTYAADFKDIPIDFAAAEVASMTGKRILVASDVRGTIDLVADHKVTAAELYVLFVQLLKAHGYAVQETDGKVTVTVKK